MRQVLKLDLQDITEDFFANTHILGIVAPLPDYQFCWYLNNVFGLDFRKKTDTIITVIRTDRHNIFNLYEYNDPSIQVSHYLYYNKYEGDFLLPEYKNFDFLWLIKSDNEDFEQIDLRDIVKSINNLSEVQLVTEIPLKKLKSKKDLMF
jgi:hypothetical protein